MAELIVRGLLEGEAIDAVSTHDLALTELAEKLNLGGVNTHMQTRGEAEALDFDYLSKPGIATRTSAIAIARLVESPV